MFRAEFFTPTLEQGRPATPTAMLIEPLFLRVPRGAMSRLRLAVYRALGMRQGKKNRMEGGGRVRRCSQIAIGDNNAFTQGCWLWPEDTDFTGIRIRIGNSNYFNRNLMIDACGSVEIGDRNMFGPDVYITDSNHQFGRRLWSGRVADESGDRRHRQSMLDWREGRDSQRGDARRRMRGGRWRSGHPFGRAGRGGCGRAGPSAPATYNQS